MSTPAGIRPEPSDEEAAAIAAAVEALWPRRVVVVPADHHHATAGWRWSGRWWAKPVAARRDRPWY